MPSPETIARWTPQIAALLRGDVPEAVREMNSGAATALADACIVHGVHGVLYHQIKPVSAQWGALPMVLRDRLEYRARADMAWELAHKAELIVCLRALFDAGVDVLILKGTALAYSLYPVPSIRSRGDTDLFVRANDVPILCQVLAELGYERDAHSQRVGYKANLTKKDQFGVDHVFDVHCRPSSNQVFAALFDWKEAHRCSIAVPILGAHARVLGHVHALLHGCVHRAAHFHSPYYVGGEPYLERNRLIWLYDMRLLASALQEADWRSFVHLAHRCGVSALCRDALQASEALIGATVPVEVFAALAEPRQTELSAQLLKDSAWRVVWVDFCAQRGIGARLSYLRALFFPGREYMLRLYAGQSAWQLPYLYVRRVLEGARRRIRRFR